MFYSLVLLLMASMLLCSGSSQELNYPQQPIVNSESRHPHHVHHSRNAALVGQETRFLDNSPKFIVQSFNVSGILTFHGLAKQQPSCNETMTKLVKSICSKDDFVFSREARSVNPPISNEKPFIDQMIDADPERIRSFVQRRQSVTTTSSTIEDPDALFKRSLFDRKFVQGRIELLMSDCCSGQRKCTVAYVKEQIEDACKPGTLSGTRSLMN